MKKLNTRLDEAMSVTLRPSKSQPGSYKVHSVGSKMKAHGGIKPGERVKDHHIDDLNDSGIKVKYHKEAIERRADRKTIIATDPNTGRKVLKVAPKKEIEIGKGKMESVEEGRYNPNIKLPKGKDYDSNLEKSIEKTTGHLRDMKPRGKPGFYVGGKKVDVDAHFKAKREKRLGKEYVAKHPYKEETVNELSDKTKLSYIDKRNRQITDKEKMHLNIGAKVDKDKNLAKMRKGVAMAKGKLGEDNLDELSSKTMKNYIRKAASPVDKRSMGNQASKGAYKLATSDNMDAGEKEDKKAFNRGRGIQRAAKKLYSRTNEGLEQDGPKKDLSMKTFGAYAKAAAKGGKAASYLTKKVADRFDQNKKNDPGSAKKGLSLNVVDQDKAKAKAKKRMDESEALQELSPELVKKVAHKRNVNVSMAGSKADYDRRDPDYQKAAEKQSRNQKLRFGRGANAIKKARLSNEETVSELKINTMKKYQSAASADMNDQENARHKNYPEKQIDARQAKREKGIRTADKRIAKKQVKMAKGVAFDKRYKGGNMTGASKAIDKIKPGLSDHPKVKDALRRANEEFKLGE